MWLSLITFTPLIFIIILLINKNENLNKTIAFIGGFIQLILFGFITYNMDFNKSPFITEKFNWIHLTINQTNELKLYYWLQLDGLNYLLCALSIGIFLIAVASSKAETPRPKAYFSLLLLSQTSLIGCFLANDLFLFYIFYEFMLAPMFFLIGIWGGEKRQYAAIKFFLYTLLGSLLLLIVMVGLAFAYVEPGTNNLIHTLAFDYLNDAHNLVSGSILSNYDYRNIAFWFLFIAFAVKLPVFPIHTWLPDAHVQASTPVSVLLAGILLKVGGYGLIRIACNFFSDIYLNNLLYLAIIACITIIYGGLVAIAQQDLKRMIAYSSIAHMGYVLLGIAANDPTALTGALYQMFNHGWVAALLFLLVGFLYERVNARMITQFGGLWQVLPLFTFFVTFAFMAGLGLPALSTFISEFIILLGAIQNKVIQIPAILSVAGILLSAIYFLRSFKTMFFGELYLAGGLAWQNNLRDCTKRELLIYSSLCLIILVGGIYPNVFLFSVDSWITTYFQRLKDSLYLS